MVVAAGVVHGEALVALMALVVHPVVHGEAGQGGDGLGVGLRPHGHGLVPGLQWVMCHVVIILLSVSSLEFLNFDDHKQKSQIFFGSKLRKGCLKSLSYNKIYFYGPSH